MEWLLQVVDEMDDAIGVLRHTWLGINAEFGAFFARSDQDSRAASASRLNPLVP